MKTSEDVTADRLLQDGIRPDVITGGFPCQDISTAGKQAGIDGQRSGLWGELARLIGEVNRDTQSWKTSQTSLVATADDGLDEFLVILAQIGYDAEWHCISASAIGAHHHRDRVWIVAYPSECERQSLAEKQEFYEHCRITGQSTITLVDEVRHTPRIRPQQPRDYKGARRPETMEKTGRNPETNSLPDSVEFKGNLGD